MQGAINSIEQGNHQRHRGNVAKYPHSTVSEAEEMTSLPLLIDHFVNLGLRAKLIFNMLIDTFKIPNDFSYK